MLKKSFCILLIITIIASAFTCAVHALDDTVNNVSTITTTNTNDVHFQRTNATLKSISSSQMDAFSVIVGGWWLIGDIVNLPYRIIMLPYHIVLLLTGKCDFADIRDLHDGVYDKISEWLTELIKQR